MTASLLFFLPYPQSAFMQLSQCFTACIYLKPLFKQTEKTRNHGEQKKVLHNHHADFSCQSACLHEMQVKQCCSCIQQGEQLK